MKLKKNFRAKEKEWKKLMYVGPYDEFGEKKRSRIGPNGLENRPVAIAYEFLSLTVEKISHFKKCFGIYLNIRDLFLDKEEIEKGEEYVVQDENDD
ncbi:Ubiquitin carboxyl-terminal hydrolase family protein [Euphorbia peplus]|nr:Ubiquitin carboxyl-terminal hydrolase family protein [Euphorbia peplus]